MSGVQGASGEYSGFAARPWSKVLENSTRSSTSVFRAFEEEEEEEEEELALGENESSSLVSWAGGVLLLLLLLLSLASVFPTP